MTKEEFVLKAIPVLRDSTRSKGIHSVYSGFNQAFRKQFNDDPRPTTDAMVDAGTLAIRPTRGGVMLYLPGEAPLFVDSGEAALKKILG